MEKSRTGQAQSEQPQPHISTGNATAWMNPFCFNPLKEARTFLLGCCCPCILYGTTQNRLRSIHMGEDPLDEEKFSICNVPCWIHYLSTACVGLSCVCTSTQHNRIRETYNIKGGWQCDVAKSLCFNRCTLMQADREVRSRVALDEKNAGNGIFAQPYNTRDQQMRYVPPDFLFGNGLDNLRTPHKTSETVTDVATSNETQQGNPTEISSLDGTTIMPSIEPNDLRSKGLTRFRPVQLIQSTGTVRKADFITSCENRGIVVQDSRKAVTQKPLAFSRSDTHDQRGRESENTVVHVEHNEGSNSIRKGKQVDHSAGGNDETVFVYYNSPTTPEPQRLRDCLKTNTSESTAATLGNKRARSSNIGTDSCAADERLSFEEPLLRASIRAMLSVDNGQAISSQPALSAIGEHKQSIQLPNIIENTQSGSSHNMAALADPPGSEAEGSEATITDVRHNNPEPSPSDPIHTQASDNVNDQAVPVQHHPQTRESTIMPCTPLGLEEVREEIDVEGVWKVPQEGKAGAMTVGWKHGRKVRPSFFDGNSEP